MAKSSLEKALEKYQKEVARNTKKKIDADKKLADKQRRENQRQARLDARRERAASLVSGQPTVAGVKILDPTSEELVSRIIGGYKNENYRVTNNDVNIPTYLESDLALELEKLKQYGICWMILY